MPKAPRNGAKQSAASAALSTVPESDEGSTSSSAASHVQPNNVFPRDSQGPTPTVPSLTPAPPYKNCVILICDWLNNQGRMRDYTHVRDPRTLNKSYFNAVATYEGHILSVVSTDRDEYTRYRELMPDDKKHRICTSDGVYNPREHGYNGTNQSTDRTVLVWYDMYAKAG